MPRRDQNRAKSGWLLSKSGNKRSVEDKAPNIQRCCLFLRIRL